jgi:MraZ protein
MTSFFEPFPLSIDEKGRFNVPSAFRKHMAPESQNTIVVVRGTEGCLWAYPLDEWRKFWASLENLPVTPANSINLTRISSTLKLSILDKQGRITLGEQQMLMIGIRKDIMVLGKGTRFEIWDREAYNKLMAELEKTPYDTAFYKMMEEIKKPADI